VAALLVFGFVASDTAFAQTNVTFQVNMKMKMRETGFQPGSGDIVRVAGSFNDWGNSLDTLKDVDGDSIYTKTITTIPEGAITYKFLKTLRLGSDWESDPNREYTVVAGNQTIPAPYFDRDSVYTPPSFANVTFQVNMKIKVLELTFKPELGDIVRVAGSFDGWAGSVDTLTDADHDSIYTKTVPILEGSAIEYKFLKTTRSGDWETAYSGNRSYTVPVGGGTVPVVFFDNDTLFNAPVNVNFLWQLNMSAYQTLGWFRPDLHDSIEVRGGFNGWGGTKMTGTAGQPGNYEAALPYAGAIGDNLEYKFFMDLDSAGAVARFPGYVHVDPGATRDGFCYDHPSVRGDGNRIFNVTAGGNVEVPRRYFSDIDPRGLLLSATDTVRVTLKVNMGPAKRYTTNAFVPGDTVRLIWQDAIWRGAQRANRGVGGLFPDLTMSIAPNGGDSIFQTTFTVKGKTHYNMQYTYRYIHPGGSAVNQEGGLGGQNPFITRFIQPTSPNVFPAIYAAPMDQWQFNKPLPGENAPFATDVTTEPEMGLIEGYALLQNYPNPFNPSTRIKYSLPGNAVVTLKVFNVLGQEVATLINGQMQTRGNYVSLFDAKTLATGVYIYRLEAGNFVDVKKMVLVK
jgi:hypothetical protein